jgi:hypothetical protein
MQAIPDQLARTVSRPDSVSSNGAPVLLFREFGAAQANLRAAFSSYYLGNFGIYWQSTEPSIFETPFEIRASPASAMPIFAWVSTRPARSHPTRPLAALRRALRLHPCRRLNRPGLLHRLSGLRISGSTASPGQVLHWPGIFTTDLGLSKSTALKERVSLLFRAEFLNIFNHTSFINPSDNITSGNFGTITSERDPRIGQLAAKVTL